MGTNIKTFKKIFHIAKCGNPHIDRFEKVKIRDEVLDTKLYFVTINYMAVYRNMEFGKPSSNKYKVFSTHRSEFLLMSAERAEEVIGGIASIDPERLREAMALIEAERWHLIYPFTMALIESYTRLREKLYT